jgi:hypothetical protein
MPLIAADPLVVRFFERIANAASALDRRSVGAACPPPPPPPPPPAVPSLSSQRLRLLPTSDY